MPGSEQPLERRIAAFLQAHAAMTLATAGAGGPWAATVFYAVADGHGGSTGSAGGEAAASPHGLALVFVSHERSRHARDIGEGARVAAAVNAQHEHWRTIRGVQLEGAVERLRGEARAEALQVLVARFPWLTDMAISADEQERRIASRLTASSVYRLVLERAVLIDNERFFGSREEWTGA